MYMALPRPEGVKIDKADLQRYEEIILFQLIHGLVLTRNFNLNKVFFKDNAVQEVQNLEKDLFVIYYT